MPLCNRIRTANRTALVTAILVGCAATLHAQSAARPQDRLSIEAYAGAVRNVYDAGADGSDTGPIVGMRAAYRVNNPFQLTADFGYSQSDDMGYHTGTSYYLYDSQWLLATGGAEASVGSESTNFTFGIAVGAAWRRAVRGNPVGSPLSDPYYRGDHWSPTDVLAWSLGLRQRVSSGTAVVLRAQAYAMDVIESGGRISPALTLGLQFR